MSELSTPSQRKQNSAIAVTQQQKDDGAKIHSVITAVAAAAVPVPVASTKNLDDDNGVIFNIGNKVDDIVNKANKE